MPFAIPSPEALDSAVRQIAQDIAARHAGEVDAQARFPLETVEALKAAQVLSAAVPREHGGAGLSMRQLGKLCATLAQACGASGMVLAMHTIQVACIARHAEGSPALQAYLREIVERQWLLASMTSEVGTFGDTRASICAVQRQASGFSLAKDATTGSYCAFADAILVTARRAEQAAASDQVLVLVRRSDCTLTQTTTWDTMGMRGTCSPGFKLEAAGPLDHILPVSFGDISAQTMVPYSHILWSALWSGIAAEAYNKAAGHVRSLARKTPGTVPPQAMPLAELSVQLQAMRQHWQGVADAFDAVTDNAALMAIGWGLRLNQLKIAASEAAPRIVHGALQTIGIMAFKNDSPLSLSRPYRDALSGALMISNDRIAAKSASLLLVHKDD
ncbi:MAG: acyl-CoA dehydrogenase family protein [Burkholderiales bacterium]